MARKKSNEKRLYWRDVVNRQADSGLPVRQFCAKERVSQASFYGWRRKLQAHRREAAGTKSRAVESPPERSGRGNDFVLLGQVDRPGTLEVIHPLGYQVRITGEVNTAALKRVLEVLDERSAPV